MMLADIFPPYYSTELANVSVGKAVAVFGAGPVGLLAAYSGFDRRDDVVKPVIKFEGAWSK
ncbi:MAG: hypothetical protein ACXVHW_10055 [Methanobacterium sp.]